MKQFFKYVLATLVGTFLSAVLLIFVLTLFVIGSLASLNSAKIEDVQVKKGSILHLKLNKPILERSGPDDFNFSPSGFQLDRKMGLREIVENIEKATKDDRISGIYLDVTVPMTGMASVEEIRNALIDFKASGKWVVAYSEIFTQKGYYLASVSDEIYLYPEGIMEWKGLNASVMFLKEFLNRMGVEMQVIRGKNNKFKSAVEPFLGSKMSEANREQVSKYVGSIWDHVLQHTGDARNLNPDSLDAIAENFSIRSAADAVNAGLITAVAYPDEIDQNLMGKVDVDDREDLNLISIGRYTKAKLPKKEGEEDAPVHKRDRIAIVYAQGGIADTQGDAESIGFNIAEAIRDAREDDKVKAIVLRINSGGGSALMSDIIWRETMLARESKPLVVSMGDVAASGGYYIAAAANHIYAHPNTITGSIGVFGILPNMQKLMNNKLGITFDGVKTNRYADIGSLVDPLTDEEYGIIQQGVEEVYETFLQRVSDGRNMTPEAVDAIGQGRVWTGTDALDLGLVDELGGLQDAIDKAAELAELESYKVRDLPKVSSPLEKFMEDLKGGKAFAKALDSELSGQYSMYRQFKFVQELMELKGVQARMPYIIEVD